MHYFSTRRNSRNVTFREAVERGQPPDKGLYFPSEIPRLSTDFLAGLGRRSNGEIAFEIMSPYVAGDIQDGELFRICAESINFPFPLVPITRNISALELFHGPTLAFKDVGARFMSRCLSLFALGRSTKTVVIVATSGDTGGAVAAGFEGVEGIEVVILYPKGRVSPFQERQLRTPRENVTTLEVRGSFDKCQAMAKLALEDPDLRKSAFITSANSINIARWLPQQVYYAIGLKDWQGERAIISVPSGNFGNIAAGLLIRESGLPIARLIAACNVNDTVPRFLLTGNYEPRPSVETFSNAMDVGDPNNFPRILELFGRDVVRLRKVLTAARVTDAETAATMEEVFAECAYVLDPHGAVGYRALSEHLEKEPNCAGIFLETAHPAKFETVKQILGDYIVGPDGLDEQVDEKTSIEINAEYEQLREILQSKI